MFSRSHGSERSQRNSFPGFNVNEKFFCNAAAIMRTKRCSRPLVGLPFCSTGQHWTWKKASTFCFWFSDPLPKPRAARQFVEMLSNKEPVVAFNPSRLRGYTADIRCCTAVGSNRVFPQQLTAYKVCKSSILRLLRKEMSQARQQVVQLLRESDGKRIALSPNNLTAELTRKIEGVDRCQGQCPRSCKEMLGIQCPMVYT